MKIVFLDQDNFQKPHEQFDYSVFSFCEKLICFGETPLEKIYDRAKEADVLIVLKTTLPADLLSQLTQTKLICKIGTGYDRIDVAAAKSLGIAVTNFSGHAANMMAQWTFSLLLALAGQIIQYNKSVRTHHWRESQFTYPIYEANTKTLGIIGYGKIGKIVAELGLKFGMKVLVNTDHPDNNSQINFVSKKEIFENADFISLHCMLNEKNNNMINASIFDLMKPNSYLINTARAALVNKEDLFTALKNKKIAGAAMDGFWKEPPDDNDPMLSLDNIIITPHIGWSSKEAREILLNHIAMRIRDFSEGKKIFTL